MKPSRRKASLQPFRLGEALREGKARRTPGALADAMSAFSPQRLECRADRGARESPSALGRRKIIAEAFLNGADGLAERDNSFFDQTGKELHQNQAADTVRLRFVKKREGRESRPLVIAMDAACRGILKQEDAPVRSETATA